MPLTGAADASPEREKERERERERERETRAQRCIGYPTDMARASIGSRKGLLACVTVKETADR